MVDDGGKGQLFDIIEKLAIRQGQVKLSELFDLISELNNAVNMCPALVVF